MKLDVDRGAVEQAIERYLTAPAEEPADAVSAAQRHDLLPLWADFMGCIGLRPNGDIVFVAWDEPAELELVSDRPHDQQMVHAARAVASRRFPALVGLAPIRTESAKICEACNGTGQLPNLPANLVCACGGLGWLP